LKIRYVLAKLYSKLNLARFWDTVYNGQMGKNTQKNYTVIHLLQISKLIKNKHIVICFTPLYPCFSQYLTYYPVAVLGFTLGGRGVAIIAARARTYIVTVNHP